MTESERSRRIGLINQVERVSAGAFFEGFERGRNNSDADHQFNCWSSAKHDIASLVQSLRRELLP